jgi:hypothetical protein
MDRHEPHRSPAVYARNSASAGVRPRPALFRALGAKEPPQHVEIDGQRFERVRVMKHDSWAATALYTGKAGLVVCKFNRIEPIGKLPMDWVGRILARREAALFRRLADVPGVPAALGAIHVAGKRQAHAVAHAYIPGHPLGEKEWVDDHFYPRLEQLLAELHRRDIAYVDLHKRENIIVGEDGKPYLIDFQISLALAPWFPANSLLTRTILKLFQQSDRYHFRKHFYRHRPDRFPGQSEADVVGRPWWIQAHRLIGAPLRTLRRRLLVTLQIRAGAGRAESEQFPEEGMRRAA